MSRRRRPAPYVWPPAPAREAPELLARLGRFFSRVPHLACAAVVPAALAVGPGLMVIPAAEVLHRADADEVFEAVLAQARRLGRLLRVASVSLGDCTWGPPPWALVIYRRRGPTWAAWAERAAAAGVTVPEAPSAVGWSEAMGPGELAAP